VADQVDAASSLPSLLFSVDPLTGDRVVISDFTAQRSLGDQLRDVAVDAAGTIWAVDQSALYSVDRSTGALTLVSDFGDLSGVNIAGVETEHSGDILVLDDGGPNAAGALYRVDPVALSRSRLSDFGDPLQGPVGADPTAVTVDQSRDIVVADPNARPGAQGAVFLVDPSTGDRIIISDYGEAQQGPLGLDPTGVAVEAAGDLAVIDANGGANNGGLLFRDDPPDPAKVSVCDGAATVFLNAGDEVIVTCGSVIIEVVSNTVGVEYLAEDGREAATSLGEENTLTFEPETFTFSAPPSNPDPALIEVDGEDLAVEPGESFDVVNVEIDIKPGGFPNSINLGSNGVTPIAILATSVAAGESVDFDPSVLDQASLLFAGASPRQKGNSGKIGAFEDVDGDGDLDLVVQFPTEDLELTEADAEAMLVGEASDGSTVILGSDSIVIVP
jgi:hypothetical protein